MSFSSLRLRLRLRLTMPLLLALVATTACTQWEAPFTRAATAASPAPSPDRASVVFAWTPSSCDPGGYYTLATADGRFVGNVASGTQLRAELSPGETTIVGWNPVEEESRPVEPATVPVLHATLRAGRVYTVRLTMGEWDQRGPVKYFGRDRGTTFPARRCGMVSPAQAITSAMVSLPAGSASWNELRASAASLRALSPEPAAGQAWLDSHRDVLEEHRLVAEARFQQLRPEARRLGTVEPDDGAASP
jgi:hypothetical protein